MVLFFSFCCDTISLDKSFPYDLYHERIEYMRIVFVRHGHPDYVNDCLTELGRQQAIACAEKMVYEGIDLIFSSTCGRAMETAEFTAKRLGIRVIPEDFMREVKWGEIDESSVLVDNGHPWNTAQVLSEDSDFGLMSFDWRDHKYFSGNKVTSCVDFVGDSFSKWLTQFGLRFCENGKIYCANPCDDTVAVFSHGGSGAAMLSKLFNLPFPYVCLTYNMNFTSITVVDIPSKQDSFVAPRLARLNDDRHVNNKIITFQM